VRINHKEVKSTPVDAVIPNLNQQQLRILNRGGSQEGAVAWKRRSCFRASATKRLLERFECLGDGTRKDVKKKRQKARLLKQKNRKGELKNLVDGPGQAFAKAGEKNARKHDRQTALEAYHDFYGKSSKKGGIR